MEEKIAIITISFYSTLRNVTGEASTQLSVPLKSTLQSLLQQIEQKYFLPKGLHILSQDGSMLEAGIICLINDADVSLLGGLKHKLTANEAITLISSLHGG
jgi:molybdopterin converting factor small subunit